MKTLDQIEKEAFVLISGLTKIDKIEDARIKIFGRKSALTEILRSLKDMSVAERQTLGAEANKIRAKLELALNDRETLLSLEKAGSMLEAEKIDITAPGLKRALGHKHPLTLIQNEIESIFTAMGYTLAEGPEIETEENNFDLLNIPADHPARDMWDTFFLRENGYLLRTHTSPVQIRYMKANKPPIKIIALGRVYRFEQIDASHLPNFYQCEGLVVGKNIKMSDLKGTLEEFFSRFFGKKAEIRFRQSFFPFTEPSVEVDVSCTLCDKYDGECKVCKGGKWLELAGAGMVHPTVLRNVGIDPEEYSGFAFGMGVDRLCLLKYSIEDIRNLYSANLGFLEQF